MIYYIIIDEFYFLKSIRINSKICQVNVSNLITNHIIDNSCIIK